MLIQKRQLNTLVVLGLFLLFNILLIQACASEGNKTFIVEPSNDNLLILAVKLESITLTEDLIAYFHPEGVLLPLGYLSEVLNLAIKTYPEEGLAEGFFLSEDRRFFLDVNRNEVTIEGKLEHYKAELVEVHWDDIYVEKDLIAQWLPLDLEVNFFSLTLKIDPREPLPLQLLLERERRMARLKQWFLPQDPGYPRLNIPYDFLSEPVVDQNIYLSFYQNQYNQTGTDMKYSTLLTADLAYMTASLFLMDSKDEPLSDINLTMGKSNPDPVLLGPLKAREFILGNNNYPALSLISKGGQGQGIKISSYPLKQLIQFDQHTFYGELQPGWDIELYHNNILIDYRPPGEEVFYSFEKVPLLYGMNQFRLVFHGPEGQERKETYNFNIGDSLIPEGEGYYSLVYSQDEEDYGRFLFSFDQSLNQQFTAHLGLTSLPVNNSQEQFVKLGLSSFCNTTYLHGELVASEEGGFAGKVNSLIGLNWGSLFLEHIHLNNYISEVYNSEYNLFNSTTRFRLDSVISSNFLPNLPVTFSGYRNDYQSGKSVNQLELTTNNNVYYRGLRLNNRLNINWNQDSVNTGELSGEGSFFMRKEFDYFNIHGQIGYDFYPSQELRDISMGLNSTVFDDYHLHLDINRRFSEKDTDYTLQISRKFAGYSAGLNTSYSSSGQWNMGLALNFSLGKEPHKNIWQADAASQAKTGSVSVRVYLLNDSNQGEPIEDIAFLVNNKRHKIRTDENGIAFIKALPVNQPVDLSVDVRTLEDPSWIVGKEGVRIIPRLGKVISVDFPVMLTAEIDGSIFLKRDEKLHGVSGILVELLNEEGKILNTARSAFDGFYIITQVPPGRYSIRVNPEQIERYRLKPVPEQSVEIGQNGEWISGMDFILHEAEKG